MNVSPKIVLHSSAPWRGVVDVRVDVPAITLCVQVCKGGGEGGGGGGCEDGGEGGV